MQDEHQYFEKEAGRPAGQNQADSPDGCYLYYIMYREEQEGRPRLYSFRVHVASPERM